MCLVVLAPASAPFSAVPSAPLPASSLANVETLARASGSAVLPGLRNLSARPPVDPVTTEFTQQRRLAWFEFFLPWWARSPWAPHRYCAARDGTQRSRRLGPNRLRQSKRERRHPPERPGRSAPRASIRVRRGNAAARPIPWQTSQISNFCTASCLFAAASVYKRHQTHTGQFAPPTPFQAPDQVTFPEKFDPQARSSRRGTPAWFGETTYAKRYS